MRDVLKKCAAPKTRDGKDICCAYHLKGNCFDDCKRSNTHYKLAEEDEKKLLEFVKVNIVDQKVGEARNIGQPSQGCRPPTVSSLDQLKIDTLGEFIKLDTDFLENSKSWVNLFKSTQGRSNFQPNLHSIHHPEIPLLSTYAKNGVQVLLSTDLWSLEQKDAAIERGCHKSASDFTSFLREEMATMRQKGMFIVMPYKLIRDHPYIHIIPIGCIPQRDRSVARLRTGNDEDYEDEHNRSSLEEL